MYAQNDQSALGTPATAEQIKAQDITVPPDGTGLPNGRGAPVEGEKASSRNAPHAMARMAREIRWTCTGWRRRQPRLQQACEDCRQLLAGTHHRVGLYPSRDAQNSPGSLSPDEIYAVTAFVLNRNDIIPRDEVMNKETLPKVRMANRDGFVPDARPDTKNTTTQSK